MSESQHRRAKILLPVLVLAVATLGTVLIVQARPDLEKSERDAVLPTVRVVVAELRDVPVTVTSQGTVYAPTESDLVAEVSGRVVWVSRSFEPGGFLAAGEELLRLDPRDYELNVESARAQVAQARVLLLREEAEAEVARREWSELGEGEADPLVLRQPQVMEARARLDAAQAALERAELDLERTHVRSPYGGRIRSKTVDLGEFVSRGTPLASIYAVDVAEVRLPVPDAELAYLDLPLHFEEERVRDEGPAVRLSARFGGRRHTWEGRIDRTEGEVDRSSRMLHLVARVEDPYHRSAERERPPLAVGMFVEAEIDGRTLESVVELPRQALRASDLVMVVDEEDRLRFRQVDVARSTRDAVLVGGGLESGLRVVVSPLEMAVEGMLVRAVEEEKGGAELAAGAAR